MLIKKIKSNIFLIGSLNVFLNNYFYQFLVFLLFLRGDFSIISEITLLLAPLIFLREAFSSNQRTLLLSDKRQSLFKIFLRLRTLYSSFIFIIYIFLFLIIFNINENISLFVLIVILINFLWFNELTITSHEINNNKKKIIENLIFLIILYIISGFFIFFQINNFIYIPLVIIVFLTIKYIYFSKINIFFIYKQIQIKKKINYKFLSTVSLNLANLIWRIFFFISLEKEYAGVLFAVFAIMSFPSSFYSNTIGMRLEILKQKNLFKIFLMIYYFIILYAMYYIFLYKVVTLNDLTFTIFSIKSALFSFLGSIIMIFAIVQRIKIINYKKKRRDILFKIDIIYSIMNIISLVIVYIFLGSYFFYLMFFISSISSLIYYIYYKKLN